MVGRPLRSLCIWPSRLRPKRRAPRDRIGDQIDPESMDALASPRRAGVSGFSLHANTSVPDGDRQRPYCEAVFQARG